MHVGYDWVGRELEYITTSSREIKRGGLERFHVSTHVLVACLEQDGRKKLKKSTTRARARVTVQGSIIDCHVNHDRAAVSSVKGGRYTETSLFFGRYSV